MFDLIPASTGYSTRVRRQYFFRGTPKFSRRRFFLNKSRLNLLWDLQLGKNFRGYLENFMICPPTVKDKSIHLIGTEILRMTSKFQLGFFESLEGL